MHIYAEVQDSAGTTLGYVYNLLSCAVTRSLDGAGSFDFSVPSTDEFTALLTNKRRVLLYLTDYMGVSSRQIGYGIIDHVRERDTGNQWTTSVSGPDILAELKYTTTLIGRQFSNQDLDTVVTTLTELASGWAADVESGVATDLYTARFDGETLLRALQIVAEHRGAHLRLAETGKTVEFGEFGTTGEVVVMNAGQFIHPASYSNHSIAYLENITLTRRSEAIATRIYLLGAGANADASLTLETSTRTTPYTRDSTVANGRTHYYIEDTDATDAYGLIQKVATAKTIAPLENTVASITLAANALDDFGCAWLARNSTPQDTLNITVTKLTQAVRPGDKIRLTYKGRVQLAGKAEYVFRDYDDDFWVMSVTENIDTQGVSVSMEISNLDRYENNEADVVIGALEELRVSGLRVQPTFGPLPFYLEEDVDSTHPIERIIPIIDDAVFELNRAKLFIRTTPFRANARGAAATTSAASAHIHAWGSVLGTPSGGGGWTTQTFSFADPSGNIWFFNALSDFNPAVTTSVMTATETPSHTHTIPAAALDYGIYDDTGNYPTSVTIEINGSTVVSGADSGGAGLNTVYDVTDYFKPPTATALRQDHALEISCASNQGTVEALFVFWCTFLPFKFT